MGEATHGWLITGVGSSRVPLKQVNHACETLLTLGAEPWCAQAQDQGGLEYPTRALGSMASPLPTDHIFPPAGKSPSA
ncbi:MAG TPA: hypothetical protein VGC39_00610 [Candidatus Methylacidiphilales bacterium]